MAAGFLSDVPDLVLQKVKRPLMRGNTSFGKRKMIKKLLLFFLFVTIAGCTGPASNSREQLDLSPQSSEVNKIVIGTGGATGMHFPTGRAICGMLNRFGDEHRVFCEAKTTKGTVFNINSVSDGSLDLGLGRSDWIYGAHRGEPRWQGAPRANLRTIFGVLDESVHILANNKIREVSDLQGYRVNIGEPNTIFRSTALATLSAHDIATSDIQVSAVEPFNAFRLLRKGDVDAVIYTVADPSKITNQTLKSGGITIIPVDDPEASRLVEKYPYFVKTMIDTSWYNYSGKKSGAIHSIGYKTILFAIDETPDEIVYQLTRAVFENLETFRKQHISYKNLSREGMLDGLERLAPIHPGALKYYREIGLM